MVRIQKCEKRVGLFKKMAGRSWLGSMWRKAATLLPAGIGNAIVQAVDGDGD